MTGLSLTVCGSSGTHAANGRACSSYLVSSARTRLLLDCGNGALANLTQRIDVAELDAVLLSHLHPDHCADVYGLSYALGFHPDGERSVTVYAPAGAGTQLAGLLPEDSRESFLRRCRFVAVAAGQGLSVGDLRVELFAARHPVETVASRVSDGTRVIAFSGDSAPTEQLTRCAREADLFLCEATWSETAGPFPEGVHMTGVEAGRQGADARARRLVLTHVFPTYDPRTVAAQAAVAFDGPVTPAADLQEFVL